MAALDLGELGFVITADTREFDARISEVEAKAKKLDSTLNKAGSQRVAPKVDSGSIDQAGKSARTTGEAVEKLSQTRATPRVDSGSIENAGKAARDAGDEVSRLSSMRAAPKGDTSSLDAIASKARVAADELGKLSSTTIDLPDIGGASGKLSGLARAAADLAPKLSAAGAAGTVLAGGWNRLTSIDDATFKLKGLGHSAEDVQGIMDSALSSVKGTAYGLGDAVSAAANAVASGAKPGEELTQVLKTMADTAAISGASLGDMGMIFNSVMARDKLQGDDMLQLLGRGVPVLQLLSDQLGVTAADVSAMVSDGKIDFETFEAAMRKGMGGAAVEMGGSITGSLANVKAAIGRLGAAIEGPAFKVLPGLIGGITIGIDSMTDAVGKAVELWDKLPGPVKDFAGGLLAVQAGMRLLKTSAGVSIIEKLTGAFASGKGSVREFGATFSEAYGYMRQANPEMGRASAALHVLGGKGGVASAALGKVKGAASGIVDALGGPWGLAMAAGAAAITEIVRAHKRAKEAQEEYTATTEAAAHAQDTLTSSLAGTKAALNTEQMELAGAVTRGYLAEYERAGKIMDGFFANTDKVSESTGQNGKEAIETARNIRIMGDAYKLTKDELESSGKSMQDVGKIVAEGGDEYLALVDKLRNTDGHFWNNDAEAGELAAQQLEQARTKIEQMIEAARNLDPATQEIKNGLQEVAGAGDDANAKLSGLNRTLQAMGLAPKDAELAMREAAEATAELGEKMAKLVNQDYAIGGDLFTKDGGLDWANENARTLSHTLQDMGDELKNVAVNGGDVPATFADMQGQLEGVREQFGLTEEQWQHLLDQYSLNPEKLTTIVSLEGASDAAVEIGTIAMKAQTLEEGQHSFTIDALTDNARAALDDLGIKATDLPDGNVEVTAPTEEAQGNLDRLVAKIGEVDTSKIDVDVLADTTPLEIGVEHAQALVDELDIANPTPTADMIIDELQSKGEIARGDLEYLNQQSANPVADLNKLLLDSGVADAHSQLQGVDDHNTESVMKGNNDDVVSKAQTVARIIDLIPGTKTIRFVGELIGNAWNRVTGGGGGSRTGSFAAEGMRIPGFMDGGQPGYRLPLTGPGTSMVDGFLGLNGDGMPIARVDAGEWVVNGESSDRYNRTLAAINANNPRAIMASLARELPAYADGGRAKSEEVIAQLSAFDGGPYVMGGFSPSSFDCSGAVAATVNTWLGLDPFDSRMSTVNEGAWLAAKGFENGRGNGNELVVGWYDYGGGANGHTALMLPDGTYIESGGNTGQGFTIGGPAGPLDGRGFTNFMYLPGSGDDSADGGLTGDLGETDGYGTTFDDVSLAGIGTSYSGSSGKNSARAYAKAARSARVARATSGIGRNPGGASADVYGSASAWNSIMRGDFSPEAIRLASNGQGFAGLGMSAQDIIGPEVTEAVTDALREAGFKGDVSGALGQELMINVGMSEETLSAFKSLEEARDAKQDAAEDVAKAEEHLEEVRKKSGDTTDQLSEKILEQEKNVAKAKEKAAQPIKKGSSTTQADLNDKVAKEEKKLADLREQATEKQNASTEEMADAERGLAIARQALAAAGSAEAAAMIDLRIAAAIAAVKIVDKVMSGITGAITGAFQGVADRAARLSGVMSLLSENIDLVTQASEKQMAAHQTALAAQIDAQKALDDAHETERQAKSQEQQDIRAVQQAEFDLAMARSDAADVVGYRETVLSEVRERGILQVAATSNAADRAAIQAASNVATAEAALAQARAALDKNNFDRTVNVAESNKALDRAQEKARYEMDRLTRASLDLARSQNLAAGEIGGAGALEEYIKGLQDNATSVADMAAADAKSAQLSNLWIGNWGKFGEAANERMAAESRQTEARAKIQAWESEAMKELAELEKSNPEEAQRMRALIDLVKNPSRYELGDVSTGIADFFSGSDGSLTRAKKMGTTQAAFLEMQRILAESNERIKEGQYTSDKETKAVDDEYKAKEIDWQIQDLNDLIGRQDEKDILADTLATLQDIYDEHQQENKQLGGIDSKLDKRNQSVLMSIGGSTWGNGANDRLAVPTNSLTGFGGLSRNQVSAYDSLNMENGWVGTDILRPITEYISDTAADAAAAGKTIEGLPETVAEGRYARLMNAPVAGAVESAQSAVMRQQRVQAQAVESIGSAVAQLLNPADRGEGTTTVGTQFTGDVTINSAKADSLVDALGNQLLKG